MMYFKCISKYFLDVLNFRNYIEIPDNQSDYFRVSFDEMASGIITQNPIMEKCLSKWSQPKSDRKNKKQSEDHKDECVLKNESIGSSSEIDSSANNTDDDEKVDVLLIPKIVCDLVPHYEQPSVRNKTKCFEFKKVSLLYIKAKLDVKSFKLIPLESESVIWADPVSRNDYSGFFGSWLRRVVRMLSLDGLLIRMGLLTEEATGIESLLLKPTPGFKFSGDKWSDFFAKVEQHFKAKTGRNFKLCDSLIDKNGISHDLYEKGFEDSVVVIKDETVIATHNIVKLLNAIACDAQGGSALLRTMLSDAGIRKTVWDYLPGRDVASHKGQMKDGYPLADAQRGAVHALTSLCDGEVLAVSGPPGTGKTTMLQSVVANMIVSMTLSGIFNNKKTTSPLLLATSANNKAITNIIDAFSDYGQDESKISMHSRWICYDNEDVLKSVPMAVYMPSKTKSRSSKDYFITDRSGGLNYGVLRQRYFRDKTDFLKRACTVMNCINGNLNSVMSALSEKLIDCDSELKEIESFIDSSKIDNSLFFGIIDTIRKDFGERDSVKKYIDSGYGEAFHDKNVRATFIDRLLDITLRHEMYWIAVHYNECKWLKMLDSKRTDEGGLKKVFGISLLNEIRYLCPCVVSTFFMAPNIFSFGSNQYNFELADLLIVDEAGQVSPEIGLPTFALAKKAIVVGDTRQIPPVHSITDCYENEYWNLNMPGFHDKKEHDLLSCSKSSIMSIAEHRCRLIRKSKLGVESSGLFLDEHRRCVDEIIDYSNQLIYNGGLTPKRGKSPIDRPLPSLPPMAICPIESSSSRKDGSRFNKTEASCIGKWINDNAQKIITSWSRPGKPTPELKDLICIITPFKSQSELLKQNPALKEIPIGTVHTFQGAESPIVLFSMVYGTNESPTFIESNHELMNVAVSRAKDHFIVFGSRECLSRNRHDAACNLLFEKLEVINNTID